MNTVARPGDVKCAVLPSCWDLADLTRPYLKQGQGAEAESDGGDTPSSSVSCLKRVVRMEWGTESQNTRLEKIQSLSVNPESEPGNFLYGDSQMQAVTHTGWAALKAQLYIPCHRHGAPMGGALC